jgi:aspartyl-tRNA(Asn)/glutamyl-tRNA(Gln) amidotransferase subunit A
VDIPKLSVDGIHDSFRRRDYTAQELCRKALAFAEAENPKTNAYLMLSPERALATARCVDERLARGEEPGVLAGVPIAIKDVILTKGLRSTFAVELHPTLQRNRGRAAGSGGRGGDRQDQLR